MLGQRKLFQKAAPGVMHAFIFWGFLVLLPTIVEAMLAAIDPYWTLPYLGHVAWFAFLQDLFAILVVLGVAIAFAIRKIQRPDRFRGCAHGGGGPDPARDHSGSSRRCCSWNASRIALGSRTIRRRAGLADALSGLFGGGRGTEMAERVLVWSHLLIVLGFLTYLPRSKHLHIITAAPNVYLAQEPTSRLPRAARIDLEAADADVRLRRSVATDLSRKQLLDLFSCTECGRCQEVCPAWNTGKALRRSC